MAPMRLVIVVTFALYCSISAQYAGMELPAGLSPRYYLGGLIERQSGVCVDSSKEHSCLDVGNASSCCENDNYCMIDTSFNVQCCAIGSNCGITACDSAHYICPSTVTSSGTATVTAACCPRSCPTTSQFKCDASLGGGCCGYGSVCASGNKCISTATPTTVAVVSQIPSGCTTSQLACPSSIGGGCCNIGLACTVVDNTNYCAAPTGMATRTGANGILATAVPKPSSGLSTGAKAGIGAGVAVGACVAVGIFLWFCLAHRKSSRSNQSVVTASGPEMSQGSETGITRPGPGRQASDYFGPVAAPGPFTDSPISPASRSPAGSRGVPANPQSPGDITTPVEIDSRDHSNVTSPGLFEYSKTAGSTTYPVELP
ncbi:hypothetical protein ONS95_003264 [Cadophora gregata]|uniref:uncharacterized protein n=1 Tax=Cadophora gregata TaxID=51156 RepID=UPI0026DD09E3|nr:uncharacterized protein ONS95_003264 [Cadophora gregata]KAK0108461.1 hypothetical protein ONS95_003264 [Cadophora gregata]KAK0108948.1 hypothetical protein ONS96_002785 [Cadophora gregata f. sp. sojae]